MYEEVVLNEEYGTKSRCAVRLRNAVRSRNSVAQLSSARMNEVCVALSFWDAIQTTTDSIPSGPIMRGGSGTPARMQKDIPIPVDPVDN